jgi:hypothetical protein
MLLDPSKRVIVISRDYSPTDLKFPYNSPSAVCKPFDSLPICVSPALLVSDSIAVVHVKPTKTPAISDKDTTPLESPPSTPPLPPSPRPSRSPTRQSTSPTEDRSSPPRATTVMARPAAKKGYAYVPADQPPQQ